MKPETHMSETSTTPTSAAAAASGTDTASEPVTSSQAEDPPTTVEAQTTEIEPTADAAATEPSSTTKAVQYDNDGEVIGMEAEQDFDNPGIEFAILDPEAWAALGDEERAWGKVALEKAIVAQISTIFDPEIPVNIYELGLIYEIIVNDDRHALVQMTLTSPACPVAGTLPLEVEEKTLALDGVQTARVELVWDPPWSPDLMSEAAKLELGFFY